MGRHGIRAAWGGMELGQHGAACRWEDMGRHSTGMAWGSMELGQNGEAWGGIAMR